MNNLKGSQADYFSLESPFVLCYNIVLFGDTMNTRIKELVKQAGGHFSTHNLMSNPVQHRESIELWDKNIEKFAELIIRDCVEVCMANQFDGAEHYSNGAVSSAMLIKEHFGVE